MATQSVTFSGVGKSPAPVVGEVVYDMQTKNLIMWDGLNWNQLPSMPVHIATIKWERLPGQILRAYTTSTEEYVNFITDSDMAQVQHWCNEHHCGKRMSFDTFKFKKKSDITMFLLVWGS